MQTYNSSFFKQLSKAFNDLVDPYNKKEVTINVKAFPLKPEDAIGSTQRKDFVLLKGKERLIQAEVMGCKGQAFTSAIGDYNGTLEDVLKLPLIDDFQRAIYIATLNAIACLNQKVSNTIHCRNEGPEKCCRQAADYFRKAYGNPRILMLGYQPAIAEALNKEFHVNLLDLDPANIGRTINGVRIRDGVNEAEQCLNDSDVIFSTGSIICNNSIDDYYNANKPLILYGTTGSGAAALLGIPRFCPESLDGNM
ncbi:conserved hypothetical protein [Desulfofarcimen acetoxidans DSM 771]|uniref:Putative heavy-metal chelation domain-containing protein n=1 Tax=Desulfofarcimen acetoxidans (strain ATCC 49208 / DSM 771 / KCTC 5769 / VKM B-1644 / 5575) TaxID=485916 RepID=C8W6R4_DESAS|nr:DUF364 domain-containing protein [Desulfofarcimen acetoxidans]ACV64173.1 conserved hypothetical protein [Desulfofarcimen acetoxidans DSM 771]